jgi:site-specific recombinase XerD
VYAASGDQYAVQQLLGHAQSRTTERYTLAAVSGRLKAVVDAAFGEAT